MDTWGISLGHRRRDGKRDRCIGFGDGYTHLRATNLQTFLSNLWKCSPKTLDYVKFNHNENSSLLRSLKLYTHSTYNIKKNTNTDSMAMTWWYLSSSIISGVSWHLVLSALPSYMPIWIKKLYLRDCKILSIYRIKKG